MKPQLSKDGKWMAYAAEKAGVTGLKLRNMQTGTEKWLVFPLQRNELEARATRDVLPNFCFTPDNASIVIAFSGKIHRVSLQDGQDKEIPFAAPVDLEVIPSLYFEHRIPEDAVTAACATLEAVCRSILVELELDLPAKKDVSALVRAVQEPLGLSPGRTDLPDLIAGDIRKVLSGLTTATEGTGALRTHGGDAHGRERGHRRIDPRIARLAIHAASTVALFLIETWELKMQRSLPAAAEPAE